VDQWLVSSMGMPIAHVMDKAYFSARHVRANRKLIEESWVDASAEAWNTGGYDHHRKGGRQ